MNLKLLQLRSCTHSSGSNINSSFNSLLVREHKRKQMKEHYDRRCKQNTCVKQIRTISFHTHTFLCGCQFSFSNWCEYEIQPLFCPNKCLHVFFISMHTCHSVCFVFYLFSVSVLSGIILSIVHSILSFLPSKCGHFTWAQHHHQANIMNC